MFWAGIGKTAVNLIFGTAAISPKAVPRARIARPGATVRLICILGVYLSLLAEIDRSVSVGPQRAVGALSVSARRDGALTRLAGLRQEGSLKALFPRPVPGGPLEAVFLNTSGGLTGGDRMRIAASAGPSARLSVSSQAAERAYRAADGPAARVDLSLQVEARGCLEWLPQETIVFEGAALERRMNVALAADAAVLIVEPVILGRAAMGEEVRSARFRDRWTVRRDGALVFADALRLEGDLAAQMDTAPVAGGGRAWASVLFVAPGAQAALSDVRALLPAGSGVSLVREGVLFARIVAADGFVLRAGLIPVIERLSGAGLPKVWRL